MNDDTPPLGLVILTVVIAAICACVLVWVYKP